MYIALLDSLIRLNSSKSLLIESKLIGKKYQYLATFSLIIVECSPEALG